MGCNYYLHTHPTEAEKEEILNLVKGEKYFEASKLFPDTFHIGKFSGGWQFIFDHNRWEQFNSLEELKKLLKDNTIENEYGDNISYDDFWKMVEENKDKRPHTGYGNFVKWGLWFCDQTDFG